MFRTLLKSKIHRATVTDSDINYEGSIAIDSELCKAANLLEYERVDIYNVNNGGRFSTYVIYGSPNEISLNGAAARLVQKGDKIIIACYSDYSEAEIKSHQPLVVLMNENNTVLKIIRK